MLWGPHVNDKRGEKNNIDLTDLNKYVKFSYFTHILNLMMQNEQHESNLPKVAFKTKGTTIFQSRHSSIFNVIQMGHFKIEL